MSARRIIVVLGMHRSGTSTIARALQVLGVDLGDNLLPPAPGDNERGYYEDADVHGLNMELLLALGHDWHTLQPVLREELEGEIAAPFRERAAALLRGKLERTTECYGLKDPRVSRLLPFWKRIFTELGVEPSYAIVSRNPLSVARSLLRRDAFDPIKSHYLWLEHTLISLAESNGARRVVVDYDLFLDDPVRELRRLAEGLGLAFDPAGAELAAFQREFLTESLRHTRFTLEELLHDRGVPPGVRLLFEQLHLMATDAIAPGAAEVEPLLAYLRELSRDLRPALAYMRTHEERGNNVSAELVQATARAAGLEEAHAKLQERDQQIATFAAEAAEREVRTTAVQAALVAAEAKLEALHAEVAAREQEAAGMRAAAASRDAENMQLREAIVAREHELVVLGGSLAEAEQRCAALTTELHTRTRELAEIRAIHEQMVATTWRVPRPGTVARKLLGRSDPEKP